MLINFEEISELAFIVYVLGQPVIIDGIIVDELTFPAFISNYFDA